MVNHKNLSTDSARKQRGIYGQGAERDPLTVAQPAANCELVQVGMRSIWVIRSGSTCTLLAWLECYLLQNLTQQTWTGRSHRDRNGRAKIAPICWKMARNAPAKPAAP